MTIALVAYALSLVVNAVATTGLAAPDVLLVAVVTLAARGRVAGGAAAVVVLAYGADVYAGGPLGLNVLAKGLVFVAASRAGAHMAWENRLAHGAIGGLAGLADGHIAYGALAMLPQPHADYASVVGPLAVRAVMSGVAAMVLTGPLLRLAARADGAVPMRRRRVDTLFGRP